MIHANKEMPHVNYVGDFDESSLVKLRNEWHPFVPLSVFSEKEFDFLQFSPTPLQAVNQDYDTNLPADRDHLRRQFEGDLASTYAVHENSVRYRYYNNPGAILSKTNKLDQLLRLSGSQPADLRAYPSELLEKMLREENLLDSSDVPVPEEMDPWLDEAKDAFFIKNPLEWAYQYKRSLNSLIRGHEMQDKNVTHRAPPLRKREYSYVNDLKELLGKDIKVVLFGSSTDNTAENKDYDNAVIVPELTLDLYKRLEGANITYEGKAVDVVFVHNNEWEKFIRMNAYTHGIIKNAIVLSGDVSMPTIDSEQSVLRSISRAGGRIRSLHGTVLNWAMQKPEDFINREGLVYSLTKVPRYVVNALLELRDLQEGRAHYQYSKSELESALAEVGVNIRTVSQEPEAIKKELLAVLVDTAKVFEHYYTPTWVHEHRGTIRHINELPKTAKFRKQIEEEVNVEIALQSELQDAIRKAREMGTTLNLAEP